MNNIGELEVNKKYPGPVAAGIFFSLTTLFLTYGGGLLTFKNNYLNSGIGELVFVLLPVLIFLKAGRYNLKDTLKLKRTKPVNYLIVVFLMIFGLPVVGVLNAIVLGLIRLIFGRILPVPQMDIPNVPTLFIAILVIGVSAAVCEETLFRGMISKGYEKLGPAGSLILTSILFGILHRDLQKGVSTILLGALIGFIVYRTRSIYAGMTAHFINNSIAVLLTYASGKLVKSMDSMGVQQIENFDFSNIPTISIVIAGVFYGILFLGCLGGFIGLMYAFLKTTEGNFKTPSHLTQLINNRTDTENAAYLQPYEKKGLGIAAIISVLPGVLLIFLTFTGQVLELMNVKTGMVYELLRVLRLI